VLKRRTIASAAALVLGLAAGAAAQDWRKVRIGTEGAYPPWNYTDSSGQLIGFEIDLAHDFCRRMKVECELVAQDWEGMIPALQAGKYDAIMAGMPITDEREEVIRFSDSYAATPAYFAVRKSSDLARFQSAPKRANLDEVGPTEQAALDALRQAFAGKKVGVQVATPHADFLEEYLGDVVEIRKYDTQENLDLDLQAGRVDVALASMSYWQPLLSSDDGVDLTLIGPGMTGGPFGAGVGVGIRREDAALALMFNKAIAEAKADGTIAERARQWFGFDASS
jgi:octopine/nopaline transport system substrate-binding protein